jgi:hypothetical protein
MKQVVGIWKASVGMKQAVGVGIGCSGRRNCVEASMRQAVGLQLNEIGRLPRASTAYGGLALGWYE